MKRLALLFTQIALLSGIGSAQTFKWAKGMGGASAEIVFSLATDPGGNVLVAGSFTGTTDLDPGAGVYNLTPLSVHPDAFVVKLDSNGNFIWAKQVGGTAADHCEKVVTDAGGNVYIMGSFNGTVDFDPGPGAFNMTSLNFGASVPDLFVVKLDAAGNFVWAIQRSGEVGAFQPVVGDMELDAGNNIYLTYMFKASGAGGDTLRIEKTSGSGASLWNKSVNATSTMTSYLDAPDLAVDESGNVIVTGTFYGEADLDPNGTQLFQTTNHATYVLKLSNAGNLAWVRTLVNDQPASFSEPAGVATDIDGNIFVGGRFGSTVDFDPGSGTQKIMGLNLPNGTDAYILKLTGAGNFGWAKNYGGNTSGFTRASGITVDLAGFVYATGSFTGTTTFLTTPLTSVGAIDAYSLKLNQDGSLQWVQQMGGITGNDAGAGLATGLDGHVYTGGSFTGTANFNFTSTGPADLTAAGNSDVFVQKLYSCSGPVDTAVTLSGDTLTASASGASYQWYDCSTGKRITGASAKTFIPAVTGSYSVMVLQNGCGRMSGCRSVIGTRVSDVPHAVATIYPNPNSGTFTIQLNKQYEKLEVEITTIAGKRVSKTAYYNTQNINTSIDAAGGVYFINIVADGVTIGRERVVKTN